MLLALIVILIGVFVLQQKPHKPQTPRTRSTTTTQASRSTAASTPSAHQDSLQISSGPTWIRLQSLQSLTLYTSSLPTQQGVAVSLELFPKIQSRSQFQVIMKYGLKSLPIASSPPVDLTQLSHDSTGNPQLSFEVSESARQSSASTAATSYIQIPYCSPNCSGVYPMLAVFVEGSQIIGTALTEIALEPSTQASTPLNVALVVQAPFTGNSKNDLNALSLLVSAINANPTANVTLNIPGAIMQEAVSANSPVVKKTVTHLLSWAQKPNHQIITSGFVPLNLPQLTSSGLARLIDSEFVAGRNEAEQVLHQKFSTLGPIAVHGGLTSQTAATIFNLGISKIVLPDKYFQPFSEKFTLSKPFLISTNYSQNLTVLAEDGQLQSDIAAGTLPYQGANQLSTDLAQIYFDQPNDSTPRVVSTLYQISNSEDAAKLDQILSDLTTSPFLKTVDLNSAFAITSNEPMNEGRLAHPAAYSILDTTRFQTLANDISALSSSLGQNSQLTQANFDLMTSAASTLRPSASNSFLQESQTAISKVSNMVSLSANKSFTVTARKVQLPIAISSQLKVPFKGVLVITSDRLSFPNGNKIPVVLNGPNTTLSIPIYAETLGLYLISAKLVTPSGQFVVAHTSIEIRSTAFSAVSIILTLGAFLVLLLWWIQSFRRGHQRNKRLVREKN
ncbi:MAG: hypothetical protein M0Z39_08285 [Actinomycetota bacterium]|nr:hypothetical protein [Actinomycetota bacterium]